MKPPKFTRQALEQAARSLVDDIPKAVVDPESFTLTELRAATGHGRSFMDRFAREQVKAGKWERVSKRVGNNVVPSYRRRESSR